jgi:hypothetical protein
MTKLQSGHELSAQTDVQTDEQTVRLYDAPFGGIKTDSQIFG